MTKPNALYLILLITITLGCKDDEMPDLNRHGLNKKPVSIDYYPQGRDYQWTYDWMEFKGGDTVRLTSYDHYNYTYGYIDGRGSMKHFRPHTSSVSDHRFHLTIASFNLNSTLDSILLDSFSWNDTVNQSSYTFKTYQFSDEYFVNEAENYSTVPCKKSLRHHISQNGKTESFTYFWFGKDQGLIKREYHTYTNGKLTYGDIKVLISTNF